MRRHETEPPVAEAALDVIPHPILVVAPDYRLVAANRAAREFAGRAGFVSPSFTCYGWSHGRTRPCSGRRHPCPLREVMRTGRAVRVTHRHVRPGQAAAVVEIHAAPLLRADGTVRAVVESIHDITEQVLREQALDRRLTFEQALRRIDAALLGEKPVQEVLEAVLDAAAALGFPMCWVGLKETETGFAWQASGGSKATARNWRVAAGKTPTTRRARSCRRCGRGLASSARTSAVTRRVPHGESR